MKRIFAKKRSQKNSGILSTFSELVLLRFSFFVLLGASKEKSTQISVPLINFQRQLLQSYINVTGYFSSCELKMASFIYVF